MRWLDDGHMTACRPEKPLPQCADCRRQQLPTEHTYRNGITIAHVVIDPTAVLKTFACPFFEAEAHAAKV